MSELNSIPIRTSGLTKYYGSSLGILDLNLTVKQRNFWVFGAERGGENNDNTNLSRFYTSELGKCEVVWTGLAHTLIQNKIADRVLTGRIWHV